MLHKPRTNLKKHYYRNKGKHQKYICNFIFRCDIFNSTPTLNIFCKSKKASHPIRMSTKQKRNQFKKKYKQFGRDGRP